ncbi:hypothetical protein [Polaromonas sp.]|uniref:hypothetical protein n=1 Tax=Polaromonas sp. TaxID=1869339 RepID=UPI0017A88162|nr:hypothetical protein [Polaromonas sp.]NML86584.1 hypothetical protein [Polaromonas sp.]
MTFHLFAHADAHIRKSLEYLEEANLAWVEHKAAAEHHSALAKMYAERIVRIEAEINNVRQSPTLLTRHSGEELPDSGERSKTESVVVYPSRANRP